MHIFARRNSLAVCIVSTFASLLHVGDYVEIQGQIDVPAKTVHIASLKVAATGSAVCARPKLSN